MPRKIAEAIAFLFDNERASYITGHVLNVDGGPSVGRVDAVTHIAPPTVDNRTLETAIK